MFCTKDCPLRESRRFPGVPGQGPDKVDLLICGEAPGVQEEISGIPFTGASGRELDKVLSREGYGRELLYIDNIVHCRPSDEKGKNRPPKAKEVKPCSQYILDTIERVQPKLILALGKTAAHFFTGKSSMKALRGKYFLWNKIPVLVTYHPAAGLYGKADALRFFRIDVKKALDYVRKLEEPLKYHIATKANYKRIIKYLSTAENLVVDLETTGNNSRKDKIVSVSFCAKQSEAFFFDVKEIPLDELKPLLESDIGKIGQNIKFDLIFLKANGINLRPILFDTMLAAHLLDENRPSVDLDSLAADFTTIGGYEKNLKQYKIEHPEINNNYGLIPKEILAPYAMGDVDATRRIFEWQLDQLRNTKKLKIYKYLFVPTLSALASMERRGMLIDTEFLNSLGNKYSTIIKEIRTNMPKRFRRIKKFEKETGKEFNPASTDHIGKILYSGKKKATTRLSRKTQKPVVDKKQLTKIKKDPFVRELLRLRDYSKQKTTYIDGLLSKLEDGVLYPNFSQTVAKTYRLSSFKPNIQNIPQRGEHKIIKKGFIARPNYTLVSADYSQVELRVLATITKDPALILAFQSGKDPIAEIGSVLFKIPKDKITDDLRIKTKTFLYATIYGSSAWGLANTLDLPIKEIEELQKNFFNTYPKIKKYILEITSEANAKGRIVTPLGATRYLPDGTEDQLRQAINFPIQNMAGFILFMAINKIYGWLNKNKVDAYLINTVHDQVIIEANSELIPKLPVKIKEICESVNESFIKYFNYKFLTPLPVKVTVGRTWVDL